MGFEHNVYFEFLCEKQNVSEVGFEPTPPFGDQNTLHMHHVKVVP